MQISKLCVRDDDNFTHNGGEGYDFLFSAAYKVFIKRLEMGLGVSRRHRRQKQDRLYKLAAARRLAVPLEVSALIRPWSDPRERCRLLAVYMP